MPVSRQQIVGGNNKAGMGDLLGQMSALDTAGLVDPSVAASHGGYAVTAYDDECCPGVVDPLLLATVLAGIVGGTVALRQIALDTLGRKKRAAIKPSWPREASDAFLFKPTLPEGNGPDFLAVLRESIFSLIIWHRLAIFLVSLSWLPKLTVS